jgi:hypothetical protein
MGVEYAHYLLAADPNWVGDVETARRVHEALKRWQLVSEPPQLFELLGGRTRKLHDALDALKKPPANLLVRYPFVSGVPTIADIMGPSFYPASEIGDRYFERISLLVGKDYRIGPMDEELYMEVVQPPTRKGQEVQPHNSDDIYPECHSSYPGDDGTVPPVLRLEPPERFPPGFTGVWRCGLMLDCGKDLPRGADSRSVRLNQNFTAGIEAAFGTPLVQVGTIY